MRKYEEDRALYEEIESQIMSKLRKARKHDENDINSINIPMKKKSTKKQGGAKRPTWNIEVIQTNSHEKWSKLNELLS